MKQTLCLLAMSLGLLGTIDLCSHTSDLIDSPPRVEYLTPPVITEATVDQKIACTRPMREGRFQISSEERNGKIVTHCYGHGGSGCTTAFGSVNRAIELFEQQLGDRPATPIRVIGSGIIGLTAAIELRMRGYEVAGVTARELYDIPSWKNAGYFALVSVQTDPEEQRNLAAIGMNTFLEYKRIYEGTHPYITSECVRYLPVYCSADTNAGVEDLEAAGLIPPREAVTLNFGNGVEHPNFFKFMTYFMDTTRIMIQLHANVDQLGIPVEEGTVNDFDDVSEELIFNCTGLGGRELNSDEKMIAVRGHLINLTSDAGDGHIDYMIYTKVKGADGEYGYVYMFPKSLQVDAQNPQGKLVNGTLGGTFIPNADQLPADQLAELDRVEFEKLSARNQQFFWGRTDQMN